jgi:hypothetical protein
MRIMRKCKICGDEFYAIKETQFFCKRQCFKRDFYRRTRDILLGEERNPHFPTKKCGYCEKTSKLNFDPVLHPELFSSWECPYCGAPNRLVWKNQNLPNSHQVIGSILAVMKANYTSQMGENRPPQYQTYKIPILNPENGNPSIVVMTCEILNILDIQKRNRKRIIFS